MTFSNPVVGGVTLVRPAVQSPNYMPGQQGWTINQDGSAEFNNLDIRGTFNGAQFEVNTNGAFFYDGTPGTGNLILSLASAAGTDEYGNAYPIGVQVGESGQSNMVLTPNAANAFNSGFIQAAQQFNTTDANQMMPSMVGAVIFNEGQPNAQMGWVAHTPIPMNGNGYALALTSDADDSSQVASFAFGTVTTDGMSMTLTPVVNVDDYGNITAPLFTSYAQSAKTVVTTFATSGAHTWTAPSNVPATVKVECWGAGGGGQGGSGAGGGGGEYAAEPAVAITPGHVYSLTVGSGGAGGPSGAGGPGSNGGDTTFTGDAVTVRGHGGKGSTSATTAGGTGSTNTTHFNGGGSHANTTGLSHGGAGGGSSAGTSAAGVTGGSNSGTTAGTGANAPTGGGDGGNGGSGSGTSGTAGQNGFAPGGGGGAGGAGSTSSSAGGAGAPGQVRITYTPAIPPIVASMAGVAATDALGNSIPAGFMGTIVGVKPGSVPQTPATWQTPSSLGTGWAIGPSSGTVQNCRYRVDGEDNVVIIGAVHTTSTTPASTIFTLPTGYRPAITQRSPGVTNQSNTATERFIEVNSSGAVVITPVPTAASTDCYFQVRVPLGNIA